MKFFIDTANVEDIKKANDMGVICGVTTNPSLIAKEGRVFEEVIAEIASIVDGPISGEVKATTVDAEGMIKEGREIAKIHPNMVVKIPMTVEGLKACKVLSSEGIKTNVTLIFSANQALLAARAGATYVSPFLGRLDDISVRGTDLVAEIAQIFEVAGIDTEIIAASVRNPIHITDCALAGADIATVPFHGNLKGLYVDQNIALSDQLETSAEKACILAEELGHHYTSVGNILDISDPANAKQERQARMWTYERLIGLRGLIDAYQHGCREYHETAEFLDVTEEQLRDAIADYRSKYGVCTKYQNYYIMFEPYLMIGKKK